MPGSSVLHYLLKFAQIHWISDAIQPSHLQSPTSPPALNQGHWFSIFPSIRVFPNEFSLCIRWPKYWSFSFSISPSNEYSGPISFRMDWLDLLAVQGTLKSLIQCHNSKASVLCYSAIFLVQLLHLYIATRKTIAFTIQNFVSKICFCCLIQCLGLSELSF